MDRDDIIRMAREAEFPISASIESDVDLLIFRSVERFANLVAAAEHKRIESRPWGAGEEWIARAVAAEREACAKVCDSYDVADDVCSSDTAEGIAIAIRARGQG